MTAAALLLGDHRTVSRTGDASRALADALLAEGPLPDYEERLAQFGRFVGSWEIAGRFFAEDGEVEDEHRAEWHFAWVLDGRAIQDVLIRPARGPLLDAGMTREYGTTLRVFDARIDAWRVVWVASVSGRVISLIARDDGVGGIAIEGRAPSGDLYRWTFSDIQDDSFIWNGYQSADEGRTWFHGQEMQAERRH